MAALELPATPSLAVALADVSKVYRSYANPRDRLVEMLLPGRPTRSRETRALDHVTFELARGDRLGIVGENGSGKSTLLKVLAGVLTPTSGSVEVVGRVSALLELGAGFNAELTGRENIAQFGLLHGLDRGAVATITPEVIAFSELREAIDQPVKTYSSGMAVRLGFACAVHVEPDILIVDEALSVGDAYFQMKCLHKIRALLDLGTTFIYVTHAPDSIRSLCNQGLWMDRGKVRMTGASRDVGAGYQRMVFSKLVGSGLDQPMEVPDVTPTSPQPDQIADSSASAEAPDCPSLLSSDARPTTFAERVAPLRTGSGELRIDQIHVIDAAGREVDSVDFGGTLLIRVQCHSERDPPDCVALSIGITDSAGREILHFNSAVEQVYLSDAAPRIGQSIEFCFQNVLCPGEYGIIAGLCVFDRHPQYPSQSIVRHVIDYCVGGARFNVRHPDTDVDRDLWGLVHVDCRIARFSLD